MEKANFLVVNLGSTSLRCILIEMPSETIKVSFKMERINTPEAFLSIMKNQEAITRVCVPNLNYKKGIKLILESLIGMNIISDYSQIDHVIYRVIQGGEKYPDPTIIDDTVRRDIESYSYLFPLHHQNILDVLDVISQKIDYYKNIAIFDSSFFNSLKEEHFLYPIPYSLYEKYRIRKYGFHGNSYRYVLDRLTKLKHCEAESLNVVICHLGAGSSICAIKNGKPYDTTMGYTALDGLMMANRSGAIDPSIVAEIGIKEKLSYEEVLKKLNLNSGYLGICDESDIKTICDYAEKGNPKAILALRMANINFKKQLGGMLALVPNNQMIIITGGMGSKNYRQREMLFSNLEHLGIYLNSEKNRMLYEEEGIISREDSSVPLWVIPANEELQMVKEVQKMLRVKDEKN